MYTMYTNNTLLCMTTVPLTLRLNAELKKSLEQAAQDSDRTPSSLAAKAIATFIEARNTKKTMVEKAIEEASKGTFISSEAMHAWMEKWDTGIQGTAPQADIFQ